MHKKYIFAFSGHLMNKKSTTTSPYVSFLEQLKNKVKQAQLKASLAVNSELIQLYWDIGKSIVEKQEQEGWKAQVIEKLCKDLQNSFPNMQGFSRTNIFRMRAFYLIYAKVPQPVGFLNKLPVINIPWGHNILLIEKVKNLEECLWYAEQTIKYGLSRAALEDWIENKTPLKKIKLISFYSIYCTFEHQFYKNFKHAILRLVTTVIRRKNICYTNFYLHYT